MYTLIHNVYIPGAPDGVSGVLFDNRHILKVGGEELLNHVPEDTTVIDADGLILMPGAIDAHVHFREPGLTDKGDIYTESRAALVGGVTSFFDMPNTLPQTITREAWQEKMDIAAKRSAINYAFFIGATNDNIDEISQLDFSRVPGLKVFMGSSTGNMLVDDMTALRRLFALNVAPIVVHAEDESVIAETKKSVIGRYNGKPPIHAHSDIRPIEACLSATGRAIELLRLYPESHLHIAHVSTVEEVEMILKAKQDGLHITCEVSPHHLLFCIEDYQHLGSRIKINPSVKSYENMLGLRKAVKDGVIDMVATDHAPHTTSEKEGNALTAASGAPMIQFALPVIMDMFGAELAVRLMCENPARIFGVAKRGKIAPGYAPDIVLIEKTDADYTVTDGMVLSKCGWTPLIGHKLMHRVVRTFIGRPEPLSFVLRSR